MMSQRVNKKRTRSELEEASTLPLTVSVTLSSAIFNLPRPIFHIIFGEYLSLKDIARFDNAVLNHRDRNFLLNDLSNMVFKSGANFNNVYFFRWLFQRRILLSSLTLSDNGTGNSLKNVTFELFPLNVSGIQNLRLNISNASIPSLFESLKKCSNLKVLNLTSESSYVNELFDIRTFCYTLVTVIIDNCAADALLSKLVAFCPNLSNICFNSGSTYTEVKFKEFLTHKGSDLKLLMLYGSNISVQVARCIATNCPQLNSLRVP